MLSALFDGDFDRFFATAGQGTPLWLFVHVPKTAGSSMHAEISAILKPSANIDIDHTDTSRTYQARFDDAVAAFVANQPTAGYRFATGHIVDRHTEMLRQGIPGLQCFTMLRNPMARIVSDYRYQRSEMNTARQNFIATTPDFAAYIARKHVHNKTALALVPRPMVEAGDIPGAIAHIMQKFAFVGLQEMYPLSLRALTTLMGDPRAAEAKVRVNTETEENRVVPTPEQDADLKRLNAVDIGIFQHFTQRWRTIRDNLRPYLAQHGRTRAA